MKKAIIILPAAVMLAGFTTTKQTTNATTSVGLHSAPTAATTSTTIPTSPRMNTWMLGVAQLRKSKRSSMPVSNPIKYKIMMYQIFRNIFYLGQVIIAVGVIAFGVGYGLRRLFAGQIFCTVCFALMAYVSGYRLLFKASIKEYRQFLNSRRIANED